MPLHPFAWIVLLLAVLLSPRVFAEGPRIGPDIPEHRVVALAPDAGLVPFDPAALEVADAPVPDLPKGVDPTDDFGALASLAVTAIRTGNWWALAALALSVVVSLSRKFLSKHIPFLASDRGGFLTVVLLALFGGLATSLIGGRAIGPDLLMDCLKVALTAAGGFVGFKKVFMDGAKIEAAGAVVATATATASAGAAGVTGPSKPLGG